jgi:hypothetical protein
MSISGRMMFTPPFRWSHQNLARWVASIFVCYVFYDMYTSSRETILSFQSGQSGLAIIALLGLFLLFALLLLPYLRVRAMFRKLPALRNTRRYTFSATEVMIHSEDATSDCK